MSQLNFKFAWLYLSVVLFRACGATPFASYDVNPLVNAIKNTINSVRKDIQKLDAKDVDKTVAFVRENFGKSTANVVDNIVDFVLNQDKMSGDDAKRSGARRRCNRKKNGSPSADNSSPVNSMNTLNAPININLESINNNDNNNGNDNDNENTNSNENDNANDNKNKIDNKVKTSVVNEESGDGGGGGGGAGDFLGGVLKLGTSLLPLAAGLG